MSAPDARPVTGVRDLLERLQRDPGRPRITWYGGDGERVELSGAVLANWVAKTTNLLADELDVGPSSRVLLDLPVHWRTLTWALATWHAGACAVLGTDGAADVAVTTRPHAHAGAGDVVAVALPALARRFDGDLPPGALDAAADVMTYPDVVTRPLPVDPDAPALVTAHDVPVTHRDLLARDAAPAFEVGARVAAGTATTTAAALRQALQVWLADGSLVWVERTDGDVERLLAGERVTHRLL